MRVDAVVSDPATRISHASAFRFVSSRCVMVSKMMSRSTLLPELFNRLNLFTVSVTEFIRYWNFAASVLSLQAMLGGTVFTMVRKMGKNINSQMPSVAISNVSKNGALNVFLSELLRRSNDSPNATSEMKSIVRHLKSCQLVEMSGGSIHKPECVVHIYCAVTLHV